jgi:hypothetical protein
MSTLLVLSLLLIIVSPPQNPIVSDEISSVAVLGFKWSKARQAIENLNPPVDTGPAPAMTAAKRNYPRNARVNDPVGARDPDADSIDSRSAAMEKIVQEARRSPSKPVDGYAYRVKVQNTSPKVIEILFWEYQFIDLSDSANVARRQFLCGVNIPANKEKELKAFSVSGPNDVVSVGSLARSENPFREKVVINRVEYADGTIWQRKDWRFAEIRLSYKRAVETPWGSEMCRPL